MCLAVACPFLLVAAGVAYMLPRSVVTSPPTPPTAEDGMEQQKEEV